MDEPVALQSTHHVPVLLHEVVATLAPQQHNIILDGTLGGGGHAASLIAHLGTNGVYIGLDADALAVRRVEKTLENVAATVHLRVANFRDAVDVLHSLNIARVDCLLLDLGLSSDQLETTDTAHPRGFSFERDEPLTMTFSVAPQRDSFTAADIVNTWSEEALADIFFGYGEERSARKLARAIVEARTEAPILTSGALASLVETTLMRRGRRHPATKVFQALRIAVNDELGALETLLAALPHTIALNGRVAIITFHSIEDRIVKRRFKEYEADGIAHIVRPFPIVPTDDEVRANPRARSAKLRVCTFSPDHL